MSQEPDFEFWLAVEDGAKPKVELTKRYVLQFKADQTALASA